MPQRTYLGAFLADDPHANVGGLDHGDIIGAVADAQTNLPSPRGPEGGLGKKA